MKSRRVPGQLGDAYRPVNRFRGHAASHNPAQQFVDERRPADVLSDRLGDRLLNRQPHIHQSPVGRHSDHPALLVLRVDRLDGGVHGLPVPQEFELHRLAAAGPYGLVERQEGSNRLTIDPEQQIAAPQPCLLGGHARHRLGDLNLRLHGPPYIAHTGALGQSRRHGGLDPLAAPLQYQPEWPANARKLRDAEVLPGRIRLVVELDDPIPLDQAGLGGGRVRHDVPHGRAQVRRHRLRILVHEQAGQQRDGQHSVHEGTREGNRQPLPAGLGQERPGIAGALVTGLLANHLHVTAERNRRDSEVGLAPAHSPQTWPKAKTEGLDPYVKEARHTIMAQFVNEDHHPNQNQQPENVFNN